MCLRYQQNKYSSGWSFDSQLRETIFWIWRVHKWWKWRNSNINERYELSKKINEGEKIQSLYVAEGNMQRIFRELSNITKMVKVIAKKTGKIRAIQNVPKGHQHMWHKVLQEKWQKKKYQEHQAKLHICPIIQHFALRMQTWLKQLLMSHSNSKKNV